MVRTSAFGRYLRAIYTTSNHVPGHISIWLVSFGHYAWMIKLTADRSVGKYKSARSHRPVHVVLSGVANQHLDFRMGEKANQT
jgi:hypothetical protein